MSTDYESVGDIGYNPWASEVAAPIEQDLRLFEFPEDVEAALLSAEELPVQAEDRSGIITNSIIAARKNLATFLSLIYCPVLRVVFTIIIKREMRLSLMLCGIL